MNCTECGLGLTHGLTTNCFGLSLLAVKTPNVRSEVAEPGKIRIYVQYEMLFLAELQALLDDIERAYNKVDSFLKDTPRVRAGDKLYVSSIETGESIVAILARQFACDYRTGVPGSKGPPIVLPRQ